MFRFLIVLPILSSISFANEFQRRLFMAAGNLGVATGAIERLGWNDDAAAAVRNRTTDTINFLEQLLELYSDPPFTSDRIRFIIGDLQRFEEQTARQNVQARLAYYRARHGALKSAMSIIYNSRRDGLSYEATCDTYIVDVGFHLGRAQLAAGQGDRNMLAGAVSNVNNAINSGISASRNLGCGFPSFSQWQALRLDQMRTMADVNRAIADASNIIASVTGVSSTPDRTPSSGDSDSRDGESNLVRRDTDNRDLDQTDQSVTLLGNWEANGDITRIRFVQEGGKIRGYIYNLGRYRAEDGYQNNELVIEVTQSSPTLYNGSFFYKRIRWHEPTWTTCRIEIAWGGKYLYIYYIDPYAQAGNRQEDTWFYHPLR
jgi:hypothetical protein